MNDEKPFSAESHAVTLCILHAPFIATGSQSERGDGFGPCSMGPRHDNDGNPISAVLNASGGCIIWSPVKMYRYKVQYKLQRRE